MNYVILNGVKSNTIKGLLIQSLPFISKPMMRTQVNEIDGRDGNLITKLGYAAYNKTMVIGLYGDYNIDDVIQYFNSEGTVTFSNEPDKYYRYQIIEQIDFERLIRFRTATVIFHVQPFKYSAVDNDFAFTNNVLAIGDYTITKNGITVTADNGVITITGSGTKATEFYVPVLRGTVRKGSYKLNATTKGTGTNNCPIRLIKSTTADSFGGKYILLTNDATETISGEVSEDITYDLLWIYCLPGILRNFTLHVSLTDDNFKSIDVCNRGNTVARPKITLYGNGATELMLNGNQIFSVDFGDMASVTIDAENMNAYCGSRLMNRNVLGNYDTLQFAIGTNILSWNGNVSDVEIENFSRWI